MQKPALPENGQAGVLATPEMIEAGVSVFVRHDPSGDLAEETVVEIFRAMLLACDRH